MGFPISDMLGIIHAAIPRSIPEMKSAVGL